MTETLQYALSLAKRGLYIFPIQPGSKVPYSKAVMGGGWKAYSSADREQINQWAKELPGCNWAVDCGKSNLVVLDVDVKNGKAGGYALKQLEKQYGKLPNTLKIKTPSGGFHYYFKGLCSSGTDRLGPGLDLKSRGGYVIAPGGVIAGRMYTPITKFELASLPTWIVDLAGQPRPKKEKAREPEAGWDDPVDIKRFKNWLINQAPEAHEGDGGDSTTLGVAQKGYDLGLSEATTLDLMLEHWNEDKAFPPWEPQDLKKKVQNAYLYSSDRPGNSSVQSMFPGDPATNKFYNDGWIRGSQLGATLPPPREYLISGSGALIRNIVAVTAGQGGAGKTTLKIQVACSIASGVDCCGGAFDFKTHGPVIMVLAEDARDAVELTVYQIRQRHKNQIDLSDLYILPRCDGDPRLFMKDTSGNMQTTPGFTSLKAKIEKIQPVYIVLDSYSVLCGAGELDNGDAAFVLSKLSEFCEAGSKATLDILTHVNKLSLSSKAQGKKKPEEVLDQALDPNSVRGASALVNNARWVMTMTLAPKNVRHKLGVPDGAMITAYAVRKTNYSKPLEISYLIHEEMNWGRDQSSVNLYPFAPVNVHREDHKKNILKFFETTPQISKRDFTENSSIQDQLFISRTKLREITNQLVDEKKLEIFQDGKKKYLKLASY